MPPPSDRKCDAHFQFVYPAQTKGLEYSEDFEGVIHLFEHVYKEGNPPRELRYAFWYGVALISCEGSDLNKACHRLSGQVVRTGIAVKIFDFFANRFGATLIFPWGSVFGLLSAQGLSCGFFLNEIQRSGSQTVALWR